MAKTRTTRARRRGRLNANASTLASRRRAASRSSKSVGPVAADQKSPDRTWSPEGFIVVYVHGIGNKPAPAVLKRQWDQALFGIDMGSKTRLAYWADIRYPQPLPSGAMEGLSTSQPEAFHPVSVGTTDARLIDEAKDEAPYGPAAQRYAERLARSIVRVAGAKAPRTRAVGTRILPPIIRGPVVEWITKTLIRDTAAYFFDQRQRDLMRARLRDILLAGGPALTPRRRFIVIGHSQGSIIAYDVLRELDNTVDVPLFVTIGSPLGLEEVQDHLKKPLAAPAGVGEWWNFADRLDPVAVDSDLADEFSTRTRIEDESVTNRDTLRISGFNPHSGIGYLAVSRVREVVGTHVPDGFVSPISKFVIARDVAREMADPRTRLPVLIELRAEESGVTLATVGDRLEAELREMARAAASKTSARRAASDAGFQDPYEIDRLRRYISANLTAAEVGSIAARHTELEIVSVWKNSSKRALIERSADVIQARTAHLGYGATGQRIAWAVLDTGIAAGHPHFAGDTVAAQWDCTRPGPPVAGNVGDKDGHGTHVAGIIAGRGKLGNVRFQGMAPDAKLHVYRVLDDNGDGKDAWIIKAIDHIAAVNEASADLVIHGVNLSLGGPFDEEVFGCGFSPICRELRRLWRQGVVVCIAAGNEGHLVLDTSDGEQRLNLDLSIGDPANLQEAIAVGSVHRDSPHLYGISYFSSRGPTADGRAKPDVVAPGEGIMSCNARFRANAAHSEYVAESGTSMACPHVSGLVAAFLSVRREFIGNPDRVKELLMAQCTDLGRDRYHQGAGLPNLVKMLMAT